MQDFMDVDRDNSPHHGAAPPTQTPTTKRKHMDSTHTSPSTWQMLHAAQGRLLDKIDRALLDKDFQLLPILQEEYATLQKWEQQAASLSNRPQ
jgi:hypothetical protein